MKTANAKVVPLTLEKSAAEIMAVAPDVSWDRARELWRSASQGAADLIELSRVLIALREEFYQPLGGDRRSSSAPGRWSGEKGWQATVREQLGISHQAALRLIENGNAVLRIKGIAEGEDVEYRTAKGEIKITKATPRAVELAREVLPEVVAGSLNGLRAWAGICGEGSKPDARRGEVDYARVLARALTSLRHAIEKWDELGADDRAVIEGLWENLRRDLPSTWRAGR